MALIEHWDLTRRDERDRRQWADCWDNGSGGEGQNEKYEKDEWVASQRTDVSVSSEETSELDGTDMMEGTDRTDETDRMEKTDVYFLNSNFH